MTYLHGVLFDFDGVLVDSPEPHVWAWNEILRSLGVQLPPIRLHREEGRRAQEIAAEIIEEYGLVVPPDELKALMNRKRELYRTRAPHGLRPDSRSAVIELKQAGWRIALVSGSTRGNVTHVLSHEELLLFDVLITAEKYKQSKPDPEPYLIGCDWLGIKPANGFVVENAPLGIASAKAAGCMVIAVTTTLPAGELTGADYILPDLTGLFALLQQQV